ncbi:CDP-glycerol glycerophosphotransferase family protein [Arthrobacter crystallopoietes]|uniref:CDP-glycerol glycerophosphotransferase n=1 Tax=Crystallibacter crystallopoietes TaxID=37928 RepID=A0A1H1G8S9_9MICC|nr:CDP-glycerol glycerophosphotransferase family protein [Arthrobacter crystallopoietes]SDR09597.1 CDP-glycerol glycerophosphotransferase [Arthrobacter crystallopoietes]
MSDPKSAFSKARSKAERLLDPGSGSARQELRELAISQDGPVLTSEFALSHGLTPIALWTLHANESWIRLADAETTGKLARAGYRSFTASVDLQRLAAGLARQIDTAQISRELGADPDGLFPLFLEISCSAIDIPRYSRHIIVVGGDEVGMSFAEFREGLESGAVEPDAACTARVAFGRFLRTEVGLLQAVAAADNSIVGYVNRKGFLTLALNRVLKPYNAVYVKRLSVAGGYIRLSGRLLARHGSPKKAELVLVGRESGLRYVAATSIKLDEKRTAKRFGLREYLLRARLDLRTFPNEQLSADSTLDAWLEVHEGGAQDPHRVRVGRTKYVVRKMSRAGWQHRGDKTLCITPYYTFKAKKTSFHVELLDTEAFEYLQKKTRLPLSKRTQSKPVWLVGERPYKAQDTGLHFFRYLREHKPEIDAYYVIDPASPEARNLDGLGNIVAYRSKRHFELALQAERFIGSHHPDFLYPTWLPQFRRAVNGVKVFLQHGVMGTKWMVPNYGKKAPGFDTDVFVVSSEREKEYIVGDFGYADKDVVVTGLSRFDALFAGDVEVKPKQLLVIPTWRDWLQDPSVFTESEYFQAWNELLHDPRLQELVERFGAEIIFCLHPNMQQFRHHFEGVPARVISQGEVDVQHLLKQSAVMVTDYSSVGFDFSFLQKPVHYYQFDRERFLGPRGPHLDLDAELPGRISFDLDSLMAGLVETFASGCPMPEEYVGRARRFLKYRDQNNCSRIFDAVTEAQPSGSRLRKFIDPEFGERVFGRFRRSRFYFPAMRQFYKFVLRTPMDENLLVFESGLGKQYADSPRYIYEELLKRNDPRTKIWIYGGKLPHEDANTRVVKRLSPEYYWYLGKAKYWVNNQNFPHYIRRRKDAIMVQTWHGTPLKRMLHDLAEVHGRDEDYLRRVSNAVRQWSVLLSPSPYATEVFRSAFRYDGKVLEEGYPRNDVLAAVGQNSGLSEQVRRKLGIPENKRVVLYAPTFRDSDSSGAGKFSFELPFDLERFHKRFGADTVLLLRMHVLVSNRIQIPESVRDTVLDVSGYPEIQELYLASDILVTDYSSVFFDFSLLRRPIIFYAYDLELYRDTLRGFYLDYSTDLPGPVVESEESLYQAIDATSHPDPEREAKHESFVAKFAPKDDGHAAERVVDQLF